MKIWKLVGIEGDRTSNHIGSICRFDMTKAELGKHLGTSNINATNAKYGIETTLKDYNVVTVYYIDGMFREIGLKACVKQKDEKTGKTVGAILYGDKSVWHFDYLGEF